MVTTVMDRERNTRSAFKNKPFYVLSITGRCSSSDELLLGPKNQVADECKKHQGVIRT